MNADRNIEIDAIYDVIDAANGDTCLFPSEGEGSIEDITEFFGDDIDVITQSAAYFLIAEDGRFFALERDGQCFIGSSEGIYPVSIGTRYEDPNREDLIATDDGWKSVEV